jgi:MSHA pilin protein MshC
MAGRHADRGFTLVELITVMILIGILAVVAVPNISQMQGFGATSFRDQVAASLRYAQKSAVAKRRMVCVTVAADGLGIAVASAASFGAGACDHVIADPAAFSPSSGVTLTPAGAVLYFQPSGAVTSDAAGAAIANFTLTVTGETPITVTGATGHVG